MIAAQQNRLWDYKILERIGQGQYGIVYKVRHKLTDTVYALKKINISNMSEKQKLEAFKEIKTLRKLNHPNIIKYYQSFLSVDNLYIIMEYAQKGDLAKVIQQRRQSFMKYKQYELWVLFKILCSAVKHLHENKVIHRDIKLENIFVMKDNTVKLGDLGLSKILESKADLQLQRVGTPVYFAPQLIQHLPYTFPIDIWALGCVFYTLANLTHPFQQACLQTLAYYVLTRGPPPFKNCTYSSQLVRFILSLLEKNPTLRPDIDKVLLSTKMAEMGETETRVSVYNPKMLSTIVKDREVMEQRSYSRRGEKKEISGFRRMKLRGNSVDQSVLSKSVFVEEAKKEPTVNLDQLLKTVMHKKIKDLDIMTERKRYFDERQDKRDPEQGQFQIFPKSTRVSPHITSSLVKTNGFQSQKFKIHLRQRFSQLKSTISSSRPATLTPRPHPHPKLI